MMNDANSLDPQTIFTTGHSNHSLDTFLGLLKEKGIEMLVDIRSNPYSRFAPHFNKADLHDELRNNDIKYLFLGKELGGLVRGNVMQNGAQNRLHSILYLMILQKFKYTHVE